MPNARRIISIIDSDSIRHFVTPKSHGNDSEAGKLNFLQVEAEDDDFAVRLGSVQCEKPVKTYLGTLKWKVLP